MATLIPQGNNERVTWSLNFESRFAQLAPNLGFSSAEIAALVQDAAMMRYLILNAQAAAAFSKSATAYKNELLGGVGENANEPDVPVFNAPTQPTQVEAGILERLSRALQRAKLSPNFNETVAEQLMIGATEGSGDDPTNAKTTAAGTPMTGSVNRIDWTKGRFDGVFIDSQRGDETVWTRIGFDMRSPYEDDRAPLEAGKPEERRYRLIYFIDNQTIGVWSNIISVITLP